jgi:hypothetical protein
VFSTQLNACLPLELVNYFAKIVGATTLRPCACSVAKIVDQLMLRKSQMKYSVLLAVLLALGLSACGKKEEAAAPAPAPEAAAPAPAPEAAPAAPAPEAAPAAPAPEAAPAAPAPEAAPAAPAK